MVDVNFKDHRLKVPGAQETITIQRAAGVVMAGTDVVPSVTPSLSRLALQKQDMIVIATISAEEEPAHLERSHISSLRSKKYNMTISCHTGKKSQH